MCLYSQLVHSLLNNTFQLSLLQQAAHQNFWSISSIFYHVITILYQYLPLINSNLIHLSCIYICLLPTSSIFRKSYNEIPHTATFTIPVLFCSYCFFLESLRQSQSAYNFKTYFSKNFKNRLLIILSCPIGNHNFFLFFKFLK